MRRTITLLLALSLLLTLSGCGEKAEETDANLDSDRAFSHYGGMGEVCATEDTVYFTSGHLIHYYEKSSGVSGVLCGKAECEHSTATDSTCNAYINSISQDLHLYNHRLYWRNQRRICSMALDGTDHRTELTIGNDFYSSSTGGISVIFHRGFAYLYVKNDTVTDGEATATLDFAAFSLNGEGEFQRIFSLELDAYAALRSVHVTMQGYGDDIYIITSSAAGNYEDDPDSFPDFYDLQIHRYNAVTLELTTLYHDNKSPINYTVEMWVMDGGIVFSGFDSDGDNDFSRLFRFDFESGEIGALFDFDYGNAKLVDDLVICSHWYDREQTDPTNPWFTLTMQDMKARGKLQVVIQNFVGDILVNETYLLEGYYFYPVFYGCDDTYAYFLDSIGLNGTTFTSLIGVALDGSGIEVLCMEEEFYDSGSRDHGKTIITQDDGTQIIMEDGKKITIIPGDGSETVTMTVEELIEKGYQP